MSESLVNDISTEDENPKRRHRRRRTRNESSRGNAELVVIGVGGAGNNAVKRMITSGVENVRFIAVNTDEQDLEKFYPMVDGEPDEDGITYEDDEDYDEDEYSAIGHYKVNGIKVTTVSIGETGLGAGSIPARGEEAAKYSIEDLKEAIGIGENADPKVKRPDMVFITAGMGGGTGTGAAPVIAELTKKEGILTVAIVSKPFELEGNDRMEIALEGVNELKKNVDSIIAVPNQNIFDLLKLTSQKNTDGKPKNIGLKETFFRANEVLMHAVVGISTIIKNKSEMNLDFADVSRSLNDKGFAHLGIGEASGENASIDAVTAAVSSPLLETSINGAKNLLINISAGDGFTLENASDAIVPITEKLDQNAQIKWGMNIDSKLGDKVVVTVIITGLDENNTHIRKEPERYSHRKYDERDYNDSYDTYSNNSSIESRAEETREAREEMDFRYSTPTQSERSAIPRRSSESISQQNNRFPEQSPQKGTKSNIEIDFFDVFNKK